MNEIKRGLFQDHYKNGESKSQAVIDREISIAVAIGFILFLGTLIFLIYWSVYSI